MMTVPSIIFQINEDLYALEASLVKEIIWVPELLGDPSLPPEMAGMFSYRGTVIPVVDLRQWGGGELRKWRMDDQVVIVEWPGRTAGLLVDKVRDVTTLVIENVEVISPAGPGQSLAGKEVAGMAKFGNQTAKMLDHLQVFQTLEAPAISEHLDLLVERFCEAKDTTQNDRLRLPRSEGFEDLTQEDCDLLRKRTETLAQSEPVNEAESWITLAVARLNGEYVGLDPLIVREFSGLDNIVPLPCCPDFVIGHMNLRGEVLTVFDLRQILNMSVIEKLPLTQVVVIRFETCVFGIAVEEVLDCVSFPTNAEIFSGIGEKEEAFLRPVSPYQGEALKYLDVPRLISSKVLEIYEEV
jgi:purine-binding chemotaxis protein CheW